MAVITEFNVEIDEKEIIRLLGYKNTETEEDILESIKLEIKKSNTYIKPEITWEKFNISKVEENRVILNNNIILEGQLLAKELQNCQYIIMLVSTIGQEADELIKKAFDDLDYLKAMIIDNISTTALAYINKIFWNKMLEYNKNNDIGITSRLSPGDAKWDIKEQVKIFECLKGNNTGVVLTQSNIMVPIKSTSAVYGFGKGIGITGFDHVCSECSLKNCSYKKVEKIQVTINNKGNTDTIKVEKGSNLLDELRSNGVFIDSPCSGKGNCGKCKVKIINNDYEINSVDKKHLSVQELNRGLRLACLINVNEEIEIEIETKDEKMNVMSVGTGVDFNIQPSVIKKHLIIDKPSAEDQRDDFRRVKDALKISDLTIAHDLIPKLSEKLHCSKFNITASVYNNELLHVEAEDKTLNQYGIAVDIGTTTIACFLMDLNSGEIVDVETQVNNQRLYGADVISRINFTIENQHGTQILRDSIINQVNDMVEILYKKNKVNPENIYNMTVVGNTTMIHLLLGLSTENISKAPFIPVILTSLEIKAKEIGIKINGYVSILPGIASYVGSDISAGILASEMMESEKYSLLLDIGTNGEIALGNKDSVIACSTAAGPAFEGANIKYGMGGIPGAISKVDFSEIHIYETIGQAKPCGICGSGVLDIVSEFKKYGVIDDTGRIMDEDENEIAALNKRLLINEGKKEFILEENTKDGCPIVFTQKDVREVQLAKAAIAAGIQLIVKEMKISFNDIDKVYIGGGFGNYMNIESALNIGMIPSELTGKICSVGNCAGTGARMYLLSKDCRKKINDIVEKTLYIELSNRQEFQEFYIDSMMF